jgi:hypothetical protein
VFETSAGSGTPPFLHDRDDLLGVGERILERRFDPDGLKYLRRNGLQVRELRRPDGRLSHPLNSRQQQRDQDRDDRDYHQKLDQRESP